MPKIVKELEQKLQLMNEAEHETTEKVDILNTLSWQLRKTHAQRALELSREASAISQALGYQKGRVYALCNESLSHTHLSEYDQALEKCEEALRLFDVLNDKSGKISVLNSLAQLYENQGMQDMALRYYRICLNECPQSDEQHICGLANFNIAKILVAKGEFVSALEHLLAARDSALERMDKDMICNVDSLLSSMYEKQGDLAKALEYYKSFHQIQAQILTQKAEEQTRDLKTQFEVEKARKETEIYRLKNVELAQASEYLKYLNASLNAANEFKSELLSIAAHDMKNPLQAIMAYAELIMMESDEVGRIFKRASSIYEASQQLFKLINSLLETSAIESGKLKLERKSCEMARILERVVQENEEKAIQKGQLIDLNVARGAMVYVDEHRLQEVLDNLISNAIKYSPEAAPIWIKQTISGGNVVRITVRDSGPGLSPEDKKMLFKKFQRLSAKPTKGEKSTGLGLWIARQLVEQHNGRIWAESDGDGKGATFFVELPLHEEKC